MRHFICHEKSFAKTKAITSRVNKAVSTKGKCLRYFCHDSCNGNIYILKRHQELRSFNMYLSTTSISHIRSVYFGSHFTLEKLKYLFTLCIYVFREHLSGDNDMMVQFIFYRECSMILLSTTKQGR